MKKVGICTVYTGYNYGSALQAVATKEILRQLGYDGEIIKLSGSVIAGRDVRLKKLLFMALNMLMHAPDARKNIRAYAQTGKELAVEAKEQFNAFYATNVCPNFYTETTLKQHAKEHEYIAFLCGSDQIWNSTTYYVDPFYYLAFAPEKKRIAFAPSFGRDFIPTYNQKRIKRRIQAIPYLSVREESGKRLIHELTGKTAEVLIDPTLLLNRQVWVDLLYLQESDREKGYVLAYFLDEPSEKAKQALKNLSEEGFQIISLPYERNADWFDVCANAGPKEFLQYLLEAELVCTDSFHGVAFSLNFEKDFYSFERKYGGTANQSTRVTSLLEKVGLMDRFDPECISCADGIDYTKCRETLEKEREKLKRFLVQALQSVEKSEEER